MFIHNLTSSCEDLRFCFSAYVLLRKCLIDRALWHLCHLSCLLSLPSRVNELVSVSTANLMFKFLNLLFQVSSNGDPLCHVGLPLHPHWNAVSRNPLTFSLRLQSPFPTCQLARYIYRCVYIIQVSK